MREREREGGREWKGNVCHHKDDHQFPNQKLINLLLLLFDDVIMMMNGEGNPSRRMKNAITAAGTLNENIKRNLLHKNVIE